MINIVPVILLCMCSTDLVFLDLYSGSLYIQCCARFLLVKCQLTASSQHRDKGQRENGNENNSLLKERKTPMITHQLVWSEIASDLTNDVTLIFLSCRLAFCSANPGQNCERI